MADCPHPARWATFSRREKDSASQRAWHTREVLAKGVGF